MFHYNVFDFIISIAIKCSIRFDSKYMFNMFLILVHLQCTGVVVF